MMGGSVANRLWLLGGVLGAELLVVIGWFGFISPQKAQAQDLDAQTVSALAGGVELRQHLTELRRQNENIATYKDALARDRAALPAAAGLADFLRELQRADSASGAASNAVAATDPVEVTGSGGAVFSLNVAVTATGTAVQVARFLDQIQRIQPRAVLILGVHVSRTPTGSAPTSSTPPGPYDLGLTTQLFSATASVG
jgi:Tfp pilus assembly protein PilO